MADGLLDVVLAAPERAPIELQAIEVIVPGSAGVFSVLPGHTPVLSTLTSGVLLVYSHKNQRLYFAVHGGFAEVSSNHVTILSQAMEGHESIDVPRAEAARARALERLKTPADVDVARAEAALGRAMARLQAAARDHF